MPFYSLDNTHISDCLKNKIENEAHWALSYLLKK